MSQFITFVVLGFPSGAIYIGISVGLVTVYLSSGILNFAQAAIALWGCYVFAALRTSGKLVFPVGTVTLGNSVGSAPALIIALVMTVILGEIIHLLIFRPLRQASVMAQIVASVAVLITLPGLAAVRFGADADVVPSMLPNHTYNIDGAHIGLANLVIAAIAIVLACAVGAYFRWTTPGVATRAASSNQKALGLMGYSPTTLDSAAWAIASVVSALMVILGAPTISLNGAEVSLVVTALAILLVALMRSLLVIAIASIVLGSVQALITLYSVKSWWPTWIRTGLPEALPFLVAIIVLFILGDRIGTPDVTTGAGLPKVRLPRRPLLTVIVVGGIALIGLLATSGPTRFGVMTSIITMVLILSYTIITGYLGQVSLAQIAFAGASGFLLSKATVNWNLGFPWALLISALFAAAIGILIGVAALRFRGVQLAIVTLAAAVAVQAFVFDNAYFTSAQGNPVGTPKLFGYQPGRRRQPQRGPPAVRLHAAYHPSPLRRGPVAMGPGPDRPSLAGRAIQRAGGCFRRHQCVRDQNQRLRPLRLPGRGGRCSGRLQPGAAVHRLLRGGYRDPAVRHRLPRRYHQHRRRCSGRGHRPPWLRLRTAQRQQLWEVVLRDRRDRPHHHRHGQPGRHCRKDGRAV